MRSNTDSQLSTLNSKLIHTELAEVKEAKAIPNTRQMLDIISSVIKDKYIPAEQTSLFYTPIDGSLKQILTP